MTTMPGKWIHLCIDMQSMFAEDTPWQVPWMSSTTLAEEILGFEFALCSGDIGLASLV